MITTYEIRERLTYEIARIDTDTASDGTSRDWGPLVVEIHHDPAAAKDALAMYRAPKCYLNPAIGDV